MTKKLFISILTTLLLFVAGCDKKNTSTPTAETNVTENQGDSEVETFTTADISAYPSMQGVKDHVFVEGSMQDTIEIFKSGTGLIFFSYGSCPFCNLTMPILNEIALETGSKVVLLDAYRPDMTSEDFDSIMFAYPGIQSEDGSIYTPQFIAVKDGKAVAGFTGVPAEISYRGEGDNEEPYLKDDAIEAVKEEYTRILHSID